MKKQSLKLEYFYVFIIPILVLILSYYLRKSAGPYWLSTNLDPSYTYLMNFLQVYQGISPSFTDHPGTPLQLLGSVILHLMYLGKSQEFVINQVLSNPEQFLNIVFMVCLILQVISLSLVGIYAFKKSKDLMFAFYIQIPALFFLTVKGFMSKGVVIPTSIHLNAEILMITMIYLLIFLILRIYFDNERSIKSSVSFGIVCGIATACKVTFLPICLLPILLLRGARQKLVYILSLFVSVIVFTAPIISQYQRVWGWMSSVVTHKGIHASGESGLLDFSTVLPNLTILIKGNTFFILSLIVCALILFYIFCSKQKKVSEKRNEVFILQSVWIVSMVQLLMVIKHPGSQYLVPAIGLMGVMWAMIVKLSYKNFNYIALWLLVVCLMIGQGGHAYAYSAALLKRNQSIEAFSKHVYSKYQNCAIFGYYRTSSQEYALEIGNDWQGSRTYSDELSKIYPKNFSYNIWTKMFRNFKYNIDIDAMRRKVPCVMMFGSPHDFRNRLLDTELVEEGEAENLYFIKGDISRNAAKLYYSAQDLEAQKKYKEAFMVGLKARELGYPGIESYLEALKSKVK